MRDVYERWCSTACGHFAAVRECIARGGCDRRAILPSPLSVRMLTQLQEFVIENDWSDLAVLPFFSMVDRRKSLHGNDRQRPRAVSRMLTTEVPYWSDIERMSLRRAPLPRMPRQCRRPGLRSALAGNREPDRRPPPGLPAALMRCHSRM